MEHLTPESHTVTAADAVGKASLAVAQASVLALQDAVANLRNVQAVATTTIGAALARMLETLDPEHAAQAQLVLDRAMGVADGAVQQFASVSAEVTGTLRRLLQDGAGRTDRS